MNTFTELILSSRTQSHVGYTREMKSRTVHALKWLWRVADVGAVITFVTGVLAGLLIPSEDWAAIFTIIVVGVVLRRITKAIDQKCANV
jgi:hypothetical protein